MFKHLQYMSTIQVLPSYKQMLKKRKSITYTQRKRKYTHWKRFLVVCRVFNSVSVIQWLSILLGGQNGQTFRFNRWKPRHWCGSENTTLKVGTNRIRHHVGLCQEIHSFNYSIGHQCQEEHAQDVMVVK